MIGAVHAAIGAAIGSLCGRKSTAFLGGLASHLVADALPHKDFEPVVELPLVAGAIAAVGLWRGADSPEFWGALGAISPDVEHALFVTGAIEEDDKVFPTHVDNGKHHGPETDERWSQLAIAAAAIAVVALRQSDVETSCCS